VKGLFIVAMSDQSSEDDFDDCCARPYLFEPMAVLADTTVLPTEDAGATSLLSMNVSDQRPVFVVISFRFIIWTRLGTGLPCTYRDRLLILPSFPPRQLPYGIWRR